MKTGLMNDAINLQVKEIRFIHSSIGGPLDEFAKTTA
jgi:hypothetical protein